MDLAGGGSKDVSEADHSPQGKKKFSGVESDGPSIPLWVFLNFTKSLSDKFKSV